MRLLRDVTLVLLVLAGTLGFSQVPGFVQEYEQRLGGALQEARRQVERFALLAAQEGITPEALAERLRGSDDPTMAGLGRTMSEQAARAAALEAQAEALANSGRLWRPLVLLRRHDAELLAATWAKYRFTLTLDPAFAAIGAIVGLVLNAGLWSILALPMRLRSRSRVAAR